MNQKDAVFAEIARMKPSEVDKDKPVQLSKGEKKAVEKKLFDGFREGKINYNGELPSNDALETYVQGLVSNWLRKDRRLNGHRKYEPKRTNGGPTVPMITVAGPAELQQLQQLTGVSPGEVEVFVVRRKPVNTTMDSASSEENTPSRNE